MGKKGQVELIRPFEHFIVRITEPDNYQAHCKRVTFYHTWIISLYMQLSQFMTLGQYFSGPLELYSKDFTMGDLIA